MIKSRVTEILYCDDTEEQRYAMRRILEGSGYTVIEAATGAEALEKLHSGVLAVVLDVKLPDMSGYEVCRRIKNNPTTVCHSRPANLRQLCRPRPARTRPARWRGRLRRAARPRG